MKRSLPFLLVQQIIISAIIFLFLFVFIEEENFLLIGVFVLLFSISINLRTHLDNFLILSKNFKTSNIVKITDKLIFLALLLSFLLFDNITYQEIILFYIFSSLIALVIIFFMVKPGLSFSKDIIQKNIMDMRVGSQLLFSNIFIIVLFNIDSIFVNMYLGIQSFAVFSFAITIIMLINQFAESISQVFFPYLATDLREKLFKVNELITVSLFGIWLVILQTSYLFIPLINLVFPDYADSELVIMIYLLTSLFTLLIRISQNNMFKILNSQRVFIKIEVVILLLVLTALFFVREDSSLLVVSIVTLFSRMIWYIINEFGLKYNLKFLLKIIIGFILYSGIYVSIYFYIDHLLIKFFTFFIIALPLYFMIAVNLRRRKGQTANVS
ncbi:hypothetical protein CVD23_16760 [Bacillus sp. V33-4]|nr:hypothetical protein CVD23_16760 [Bacillus sp. V33-4]